MAILITGGLGFIGSHTALHFSQKNEEIIILDNLSTGHEEANQNWKFYRGSLHDEKILELIFRENNIEAVIHFAASSLVGDSLENPLEYYYNNVIGTHSLVKIMIKFGVKKIVFSSTAAVYGNPTSMPISEEEKTSPTNTYGETKLAIEKMLKWCEVAYGLNFVILRYFNAAGAEPFGQIGEDHQPESHLIPLILQVALGQRDNILIFGDDYPTKDGTCIRDYIHVMDLAEGHYKSLNYLRNNSDSKIYNLGNGNGYSVQEVIETCKEVSGCLIPYEISGKREGDPSILIASPSKIMKELDWVPKYPDLKEIISHAWFWHKNRPTGY